MAHSKFQHEIYLKFTTVVLCVTNVMVCFNKNPDRIKHEFTRWYLCLMNDCTWKDFMFGVSAPLLDLVWTS